MERPLHTFPCGCSWPVAGAPPRPGALPLLDVDGDALPFCPAAWELLGRGDTKGVFQLESKLGKEWTRRLRPESPEHMGALGAILRPGCLMQVDAGGVSTTERFCRRKNGEEPVTSYHPAIDWVLAPTFGLMIYQEQAMEIARAVAGLSLQEADQLRKAIGKKLPEEMAKVEKMFIEGAGASGVVTPEQARELFGWIKESQRYSFNKSHAISYGLTGYDTAYVKAHFPQAFYVSWLGLAGEKADPQEERAELINDARVHDVPVLPPDARTPERHFFPDGDGVRFGLCDVKGVGGGWCDAFGAAVGTAEAALGKPFSQFSWADFLFLAAGGAGSSGLTPLVEAGGFDWSGLDRQRMLAELRHYGELTEAEARRARELHLVGSGALAPEDLLPPPPPRPERPPAKARAWDEKEAARQAALALLREQAPFASLQDAVASPEKLTAVARRHPVLAGVHALLSSPPSPLEDTPAWRARREEFALGAALTCSPVEAYGLEEVNATLKDFHAGRSGRMVFGVKVDAAREVLTRRGKNPGRKMAFLGVSDPTCSLGDAVVFPDEYAAFKGLLYPGACVLLLGERDQKKGGLVVKKVVPMAAATPADRVLPEGVCPWP